MINVVMLTHKDFAGSGNGICEAVSCHSKDVKIRLISGHKSNYDCEVDYLVEHCSSISLQKIINNADIIHWKGDHLPSKKFFNLNVSKVPCIITVGGSGFRRHAKQKEISKAWDEIKAYTDITEIRSAITPDLNYPEFDGIYTPHAIDCEKEKNTYKKRAIPVICHSPSSRQKKGTDNIIIPALKELEGLGYKFKFEMLENLTNEECIERKKNANIFIDQICETGFYGMSGVEAMQFGIPLIAHISKEAIEQSNGKLKNCPVQNVEISKESLVNKLKELLDTGDLTDLSKKTKRFCDKNHSYKSVGKMWDEIYTDLYKKFEASIKDTKKNTTEIYLKKKGCFNCLIKSKKYGKVGDVIRLSETLATSGEMLGYLKIL